MPARFTDVFFFRNKREISGSLCCSILSCDPDLISCYSFTKDEGTILMHCHLSLSDVTTGYEKSH